jgi:hypothetical protein
MNIIVKITPNEHGNPRGKLADAELHFSGGDLDGMKLIGFTVWKRRDATGRTVTFPVRQYTAAGERRTFALLRPIADTDGAARVRDLVLRAYDEHQGTAVNGK